jgi:hypothetical protein
MDRIWTVPRPKVQIPSNLLPDRYLALSMYLYTTITATKHFSPKQVGIGDRLKMKPTGAEKQKQR